MRNRTAPWFTPGRLMLLALATLPLAAGAVGQEIRIGGTGNALGTMRLVGDAFAKAHPGMKVVMLSSLGSSGAIKAVPRGAVEIGLASRPLTAGEASLGAVSTEYARSPLVFAVSTKTAVTALTLDQVADIYSGKTSSWGDGAQIRPILRQSGDDNTRQVRAMSPAVDKALSLAEKRPGMPFATTDQEAADKTETVPGAFAATTLGLILSENRALRALTLEGVEPTAGNGASGRYPHAKRFFLITRTNQTAAVATFVAFLRSPAGRDILARNGHWIP